eukprot:CAMPEP_0170141250 /NCGR_PEP_ID=MMETSP0033_2-20121228/6881_1 /TAXON_ID=195969 /ORGANISM="Dolichomastix tenuilepis, Strain CCMP3274" /LENGTH=377 /DNA_ID=CAMNT_0010377507 /DNA_START=476 /DNA_END=1606 /DNA_ORIENTATION=+
MSDFEFSAEEAVRLRERWEWVSVMDFLATFREQLNMPERLTDAALEEALLARAPDELLGETHIALLRGMHPRTSFTHQSWPDAVARKLAVHWRWVADGPNPYTPGKGAEMRQYIALAPVDRIRVLRALCEIRLELPGDLRAFIDDEDGDFRGKTRTLGTDARGASFNAIGTRMWKVRAAGEPKRRKPADTAPAGAWLPPVNPDEHALCASTIEELREQGGMFEAHAATRELGRSVGAFATEADKEVIRMQRERAALRRVAIDTRNILDEEDGGRVRRKTRREIDYQSSFEVLDAIVKRAGRRKRARSDSDSSGSGGDDERELSAAGAVAKGLRRGRSAGGACPPQRTSDSDDEEEEDEIEGEGEEEGGVGEAGGAEE